MEVSLSQREKYFYNINDHSKGILRQLGDGLKTEFFLVNKQWFQLFQ